MLSIMGTDSWETIPGLTLLKDFGSNNQKTKRKSEEMLEDENNAQSEQKESERIQRLNAEKEICLVEVEQYRDELEFNFDNITYLTYWIDDRLFEFNQWVENMQDNLSSLAKVKKHRSQAIPLCIKFLDAAPAMFEKEEAEIAKCEERITNIKKEIKETSAFQKKLAKKLTHSSGKRVKLFRQSKQIKLRKDYGCHNTDLYKSMGQCAVHFMYRYIRDVPSTEFIKKCTDECNLNVRILEPSDLAKEAMFYPGPIQNECHQLEEKISAAYNDYTSACTKYKLHFESAPARMEYLCQRLKMEERIDEYECSKIEYMKKQFNILREKYQDILDRKRDLRNYEFDLEKSLDQQKKAIREARSSISDRLSIKNNFCPICKESFAASFGHERCPRSISCGHSICKSCEQKLFQNAQDVHRCPECRASLANWSAPNWALFPNLE